MMEQLVMPFQYEYMQKAIFLSMLIAGVCALLSCFITLKGWSLMGDALSHAVVPGVSIAYIAGLPFSVGAFISAMLAAGSMAFIKSYTRIREDAVIGVVFTSFFALGLVLISLYPSNISLKSIALGNILGISDEDVVQVLIISALTVLVLCCRWKDLLMFCFDEQYARSIGLNTRILHIMLLTLLSMMAVAALQAVGACLVIAMLVTPGATAYLLTDRFDRMMGLSLATGVGSALLGAYASYFINGSTGGCIVVLQTLCFISALVFAPKHGLLAHRRRRQAAGVS